MWKLQFVGRRLWLWIAYLGVAVALILIHYRGEIFEADCGTVSWTAKLWHQRLCRAGHRQPRSHYVTLVTLTTGPEPMGDYCQGRRFMAKLILRLSEMRPSLIAIDKWYLPGYCDDPGATAGLQKSINEVSLKVPIILARSSDTYQELRANNDPHLSAWEKLGYGPDDQALSETEITVDGKHSQLALARLACNNWQIPLRMMVHAPLDHPGPSSQPTPMDPLALAVASKHDPRIIPLIDTHVAHHDSLVGALMAPKEFITFSGSQILCGLHASHYDETSCNNAPLPDIDLRGTIVLIGQYNSKDTHDTVIGEMPGFVLQANYIESLLDDRYYRTMGTWPEILLAILCLMLVDVTIERKGHMGALLSLAGVILLWSFAHLSIIEWGYYFTFWFPAAIGVAAKWLEISVKMPKKTREKALAAAEPAAG